MFSLVELEIHEFPAVYIGETQQNTKNTNTVNRYTIPLPLYFYLTYYFLFADQEIHEFPHPNILLYPKVAKTTDFTEKHEIPTLCACRNQPHQL